MAMITSNMIVPTTIIEISPASRPVGVEVGVEVEVVDVTGVVDAVVVTVLVAVVVAGVVVVGGGPNVKKVPPAPAVNMPLAEVPQNERRFLAVPLVIVFHEAPS